MLIILTEPLFPVGPRERPGSMIHSLTMYKYTTPKLVKARTVGASHVQEQILFQILFYLRQMSRDFRSSFSLSVEQEANNNDYRILCNWHPGARALVLQRTPGYSLIRVHGGRTFKPAARSSSVISPQESDYPAPGIPARGSWLGHDSAMISGTRCLPQLESAPFLAPNNIYSRTGKFICLK